jgi:RNA recognition motif-containing protein
MVFGAGAAAGVLVGRRFPVRSASRKKKGERPGRNRPPRNSGSTELYVGNLPYEMKNKALERLFGKFGMVASARIIEHRFSGKSKGYGFVEMPERKQALAAIDALHGKEVGGRKIVVNEAKSEARSG